MAEADYCKKNKISSIISWLLNALAWFDLFVSASDSGARR
jgi:hypothetical protein